MFGQTECYEVEHTFEFVTQSDAVVATIKDCIAPELGLWLTSSFSTKTARGESVYEFRLVGGTPRAMTPS